MTRPDNGRRSTEDQADVRPQRLPLHRDVARHRLRRRGVVAFTTFGIVAAGAAVAVAEAPASVGADPDPDPGEDDEVAVGGS